MKNEEKMNVKALKDYVNLYLENYIGADEDHELTGQEMKTYLSGAIEWAFKCESMARKQAGVDFMRAFLS